MKQVLFLFRVRFAGGNINIIFFLKTRNIVFTLMKTVYWFEFPMAFICIIEKLNSYLFLV